MRRRLSVQTAFSTVAVGALVLSGSIAHAAGNEHLARGEELLDRLDSKFYDSTTKLYVESIDPTDGSKSAISYLWPATHMLRALEWGAIVDPKKYTARLRDYANAIPQYRAKSVAAYASSIHDGGRYYDDNALLASALTEIYQRVLPEPAIMSTILTAYHYPLYKRDATWGVPQRDSQENKGLLFSMASVPTALAASRLLEITGTRDYAYVAEHWFGIFNDLDVKFKDSKSHLFNQGSFYHDSDSTWSLRNQADSTWSVAGYRAYQTAPVIQLAVNLYKESKQQRFLDDARDMADHVLGRWYKPGVGFGEISFWGGNDTIDMLLDLHEVDPNPKWLAAAQDIVDCLIDHGRDTLGYYPMGTGTGSNWAGDRTAITPTSIQLMGQAAAVNALLRVAQCELNDKCVNAVFDGGAGGGGTAGAGGSAGAPSAAGNGGAPASAGSSGELSGAGLAGEYAGSAGSAGTLALGGGGAFAAAGSSGDDGAGSNPQDPSANTPQGCTCSGAGRAPSGHAALWLVGAVGLLVERRRRQRGARTRPIHGVHVAARYRSDSLLRPL